MPVNPSDFVRVAIDPGCRFLSDIMGKEVGTDEAKVLLLAIAMQESGLEYRRQIDSAGNPISTLARGWFQFESGGGVKGVMTHSASKAAAETACAKLYVPFKESDIHESLAWHDQLSTVFARLLLWTDAAPLPTIGDEETAWQYYLRTWRPGKPHRNRWSQGYPVAVATVTASVSAPHQAIPFIKPKSGTLTSKTVDGSVQVDLPSMNRSWTTGSFWLAAGSTALYALVLLAPVVEPQLDRLGSSQWLAALPLGLGPIAYGVAREWYKSQRVKYAAQVASAASRNQQ